MPDMKFEKAFLGDGETCPYCNTPGCIEGDEIEIIGTVAEQIQSCLSCEQSWTAVYGLRDVKP